MFNDVRTIMYGEMERMEKEAVVMYFMISVQHFIGGTNKKTQPQSG
jgi:hypothetical protein